jgi:hypothetical protein
MPEPDILPAQNELRIVAEGVATSLPSSSCCVSGRMSRQLMRIGIICPLRLAHSPATGLRTPAVSWGTAGGRCQVQQVVAGRSGYQESPLPDSTLPTSILCRPSGSRAALGESVPRGPWLLPRAGRPAPAFPCFSSPAGSTCSPSPGATGLRRSGPTVSQVSGFCQAVQGEGIFRLASRSKLEYLSPVEKRHRHDANQ